MSQTCALHRIESKPKTLFSFPPPLVMHLIRNFSFPEKEITIFPKKMIDFMYMYIFIKIIDNLEMYYISMFLPLLFFNIIYL